ncbi:S8 family serine peptidase [Egicoccus sp. AB-alg2]|uniref:S8 family serine peptidase n=1 Tax=Egicoccus sp. AB-alg2 TaxID=3242693 RepID=UPI00359EFDFE
MADTHRLAPHLAALLTCLAVVAGLLAGPAPANAAEPDAGVRLLVTYAAPVEAEAAAAALATVDAAAATDESSRVQVLTFADEPSARAAAAELRARPDVVAVERDGVLRLAAADDHAAPAVRTAANTSEVGWALRNTGQIIAGTPGTPGVDIGARLAWPHARGRQVVVAVVDTGVDVTHPLLQPRLWRNPDERADGRDTDGNGYVDDVHGWNFTASGPGTQLFRSATADAHGTHVAGIIAAAADPTTGFSGAAPRASVMVLKFMEGGSGLVSDAVRAIQYASANGADVINASFTIEAPAPEALRTALVESGLPVVAAAGNTSTSLEELPTYPAAWRLPNVVSVAAVTHTGQLARFSARSRERVDVAAPGANIVSTAPGGGLAAMSGTSQATAYATGVLALALEHHGDRSADELARALRDSVRPLRGAAETRAGGIVRAPVLLDRLGTPVSACPPLPRLRFRDVPRGSAHHDAVACLVARDVVLGRTSTHYAASAGLSRAQTATLFARLLREGSQPLPVPDDQRFRDVAADDPHRLNIEAMAAAGLLPGRSSTRFDPKATVTRAEFAAVAARTAERLAQAPVRSTVPAFPDTAGHRDESLLRKAATLGVVAGRPDGSFQPNRPVRRDQAASMLVRLVDRTVQQGTLAR